MNLKESFRYQNFLDMMMTCASDSITSREHALKTTKTHLRSKVNPDAADVVEEVEVDTHFENDHVIKFMLWLIEEREKLSMAIGKAKASADCDIDAAVSTNKFRQHVGNSIKHMLSLTPTKRVETARDYKFNVEGNQMPYIYEVEVVTRESYDKSAAKSTMLAVISKADEASAAIDTAMVNIMVDYCPVFNVNESFEDVMTAFIATHPQ